VTLPAVDTDYSFETMQIGGEDAEVMRFSRGTAFLLTHDLPANAGGVRVNQYTLIMDVMFPARGPNNGWTALFQTNPAATDDAEWFMRADGGVGTLGNYGGSVADGEWVRLAYIIDLAAGTQTSAINGTPVQQNTGFLIDDRYSLDVQAALFADEDEENNDGYINSVQLRPYAVSADELTFLGGPQARGIPLYDCNHNGIADQCDIASGTSKDENGNRVPDECEGSLETRFKRGDVNADKNVNIADAVFVLSHLFGGTGVTPTCMKSADTNDDGSVNIADAIYLLGFLFGGGNRPPDPFSACGVDGKPDALTCVKFVPCE
jgi:hypothetical protein